MFAWTVRYVLFLVEFYFIILILRPVFPSMCNTGGAFGDAKTLQLYKCDGRLTDADLQKNLNEFSRLEKSGKLAAISGASICINAEITSTVSDLPGYY